MWQERNALKDSFYPAKIFITDTGWFRIIDIEKEKVGVASVPLMKKPKPELSRD